MCWIQLYLFVLSDIFANESFSVGQLLLRDRFHTALMAASIECVVSTFNSHELAFPWVIRIFDVSAYQFCKVITFV